MRRLRYLFAVAAPRKDALRRARARVSRRIYILWRHSSTQYAPGNRLRGNFAAHRLSKICAQ
jgi:hypothetical protein